MIDTEYRNEKPTNTITRINGNAIWNILIQFRRNVYQNRLRVADTNDETRYNFDLHLGITNLMNKANVAKNVLHTRKMNKDEIFQKLFQ